MMIKTIHHFEDEPELLHWIPGTLLNRYQSVRPRWVSDGGQFKEDEGVTSFVIDPGTGQYTVRYRVYERAEEFRKACDEDVIVPGDVVLLDVMDSNLIPAGFELHACAAQKVSYTNAFFLTAFPLVAINHQIPEAMVISKPPDMNALIDLLVERLGLG
jgi:hypothetical protein